MRAQILVLRSYEHQSQSWSSVTLLISIKTLHNLEEEEEKDAAQSPMPA